MPGSPSSRELHAVVVGAGLMGRYHAAAIRRAGGVLVGVVDPHLERAGRLAGRASAFRLLDELSDRHERIDVVHVCAPLAAHAELAEQALTLGAHVVVEKPLAPDASTTAALLAAAGERGLMVVPVHQFLYQRGVQRILASRDRFGPVVRYAFEAATAGADATGLDRDDLVADILPHPLALFERVAPGALSAMDWLVARPAPGELRALAVGGTTTFEIVISTHVRPTRATFELDGWRASAHADLFHGFAVVERGAATRIRKAARPFAVAAATLGRAGGNLARRAATREVAYPGLRELVRRTYDSIAAGSPPPIAAEETLAVAAARDTILDAFRDAGGPVPGRTPL